MQRLPRRSSLHRADIDPAEALPPDFFETYEKLKALGWPEESEYKLRAKLESTIKRQAKEAEAQNKHLGFMQDTAALLLRCEAQLHANLCHEGKLRESFRPLLGGELTTDAIVQISGLVSVVLTAVNAHLPSSHVILYFVFWLSRKGLDSWCAIPQPEDQKE